MLTKGTHHVSLTISDLDAARQFDGELLGLPDIVRPEMGVRGTWYQAGSVQLHLIEPPGEVDSPKAEGNRIPMA